ncbi:MAG TPA: hypothetical protein VF276_12315, partial [Chloroflexia bacterium]
MRRTAEAPVTLRAVPAVPCPPASTEAPAAAPRRALPPARATARDRAPRRALLLTTVPGALPLTYPAPLGAGLTAVGCCALDDPAAPVAEALAL